MSDDRRESTAPVASDSDILMVGVIRSGQTYVLMFRPHQQSLAVQAARQWAREKHQPFTERDAVAVRDRIVELCSA